jgi:hypothetical protein
MSTWQPPQEISNVNLEKISGGQPGFINISRHMCVGGSIDEGTVRNITSKSGGIFRYACGYYHDDIGQTYFNGSAGGCGFNNQSALWDTVQGRGCTDCGTFCNIGNAGSGSAFEGSTTGVTTEYISRDDNNKYVMNFPGRLVMIPGSKIIPYASGDTGAKITGTLIFKHPRMAIDELKYFGVSAQYRNSVKSVSAGEIIRINPWRCPHGQGATVAVVFFKKDLSKVVIGTASRTVDGNVFHDYKILRDVSNQQNKYHDYITMSHYTFMGSWWNNGGNTGPEPLTCAGEHDIQVPLAPFWDDDTVMVIVIGGNTQGPRKTKVNDCRSITNAGNQNWFNGPHRVAYWTPNANRNLGSCSFSYTINKFTETFFGCSQFRDIDWNLNSNGTANGGDSVWEIPESGSHIMKLVSSDYYSRECTDRISSTQLNIEQDSTIYLANCHENVGDPRSVPTTSSADEMRTGKESLNGKHYLEKCMSYSMNVNPEDKHINQSRCCSPKISGPFLLDSRSNSIKTGINEKIYDAPYTKDSPTETKPQLSLFNENFQYQLKYRINCECDASTCGINPCYGCISKTKETYDQCLNTEKCVTNNCCTNPCVYGTGLPCPTDITQCKNNLECYSKGCCPTCSTVCTNIQTFSEYNKCIADQEPYKTNKCKENSCCEPPCELCPKRYEDCILNSECNNAGCCVKKEIDCWNDYTITDFIDCRTNRNYYSTKLSGFCCSNNLCTVDDPDLENEPNINSVQENNCFDYFTDTSITWNNCITTSDCLNKKCYLLKDNPNYTSTSCTVSVCKTSTIKEWTDCINNPSCVGTTDTTLKANKCCDFPCSAGTQCFTELQTTRQLDDPPAPTRQVGNYAECIQYCPTCKINGCCDFIFNKGCII